jgi:2-succinyl-6-hydroxy-2,4-cyclohexadiene-1-carboxylate synthase
VIRHDALPPEDRWVFAHGFTQTARSWTHFGRVLLAHLPGIATVAVDLPGHGDAPPPPDDDLWRAASRLVEVGGPATYVGYSMGGRVALHAALAHPSSVRALVLIGATAGIDDAGERAERRTADERLAERIEQIGVEAFVDEWLRNPLFAGLTAGTDLRDDRLRNTAAGLAASLRATGTGTQDPLWDRLGEITAPVLVLAGERDPKFRELGERMAASLPSSTFTVVAGAGHSVQLEQPEATAEAIADWHRLRAPARD